MRIRVMEKFLLTLGLSTFFLFILGVLSRFVKIPTIIAFILAGIVAGRFLHEDITIERLSEIGIVLLFFYLGLEFNIARAVDVSKRIWVVGLLDIIFNFGAISVLLLILGFDTVIAFLGGAIAYASSSAITSKVIVDEKRIANPETEMILGLMVFEDIVAPVMLAILAGLLSGGKLEPISFGIIIFKVLAVFSFVILIAMTMKDKISTFIERFLNEDIFILFAFGLLISFAGFTYYIGLSEALGAFLIGMLISESGKAEEVERVLFSIRDLAVAIFFFVFGSNIVFSPEFFTLQNVIILILMVVVSIVGKVLTGYIGGQIYGLSKKASLTAGFSIVNRGEFSIVISKFSPASFVPLFGVYTFTMAFIGTFFIQYAPKLAKMIFKPKNKGGKISYEYPKV
ncbi:cation:proton antiporter [Sulfurihydrogenibium sp.]|uniref:cation:proton antiporter n=1 Tax=Sulfurihydrogenibium sp. TaxID=2053621 RepID=UPI0026163AFD|nr:cation:proton antiporter [Sulfurihydrogenibium sp.]